MLKSGNAALGSVAGRAGRRRRQEDQRGTITVVVSEGRSEGTTTVELEGAGRTTVSFSVRSVVTHALKAKLNSAAANKEIFIIFSFQSWCLGDKTPTLSLAIFEKTV